MTPALTAWLFCAAFCQPDAAKETAPPPAVVSEAIKLETAAGPLYGTIDLPSGKGPFPVVVMIAGSGPTDRDGNQPRLKTDNLKMLGQALAARGIAVVRYDRRGIGKSAKTAPKEADLRLEFLADDVVGWISLLRRDPRFKHVGVVGHSEGALVGLLAAKRADADAYVSLAGAGWKAGTVLRQQLTKNLPDELQRKAWPIIDALEAGRTVADLPNELAPLFRPSVQPYLISYMKYDPAEELASLKCPVLIVQGTTDVQETVEGARRLAAARKGSELCLIEGMCHTLKHATTQAEQMKAYFDPTVPVMPEVVDAVAKFLSEMLAPGKEHRGR
jgi:uncharacterized protein